MRLPNKWPVAIALHLESLPGRQSGWNFHLNAGNVPSKFATF
jgi:hypothetical protein